MRNRVQHLVLGFSPKFHINQVNKIDLRDFLIDLFKHWGMPKKIRVDNGSPFGSPLLNTIPPMALWLISLGIEMIWNRPGIAQDNAKIERLQGTTSRWTEYKTCLNLVHLQKKLDEACLIQREKYRVTRLGLKTRLEAFPDLKKILRPYDGKDPIKLEKLYDFLSTVTFVRKVNGQSGMFTFFNRVTLLSSKPEFRKLKRILIRFNTEQCHWMIFNDIGKQVAILEAPYLNKRDLRNLTVCQRIYMKCQIFMSQ